jgi:hypothetical protein
MMNLQASPLLNVEAPAFSPIALPKPGRRVDEIWSSREVSDFLSFPRDTRLISISIEHPNFTQRSACIIGANFGRSATLGWSIKSRIKWYLDFEADVYSTGGKILFIDKET